MAYSYGNNGWMDEMNADGDRRFRDALVKTMAWNGVPIAQMAKVTGESEEFLTREVDALRRGWAEETIPAPPSTVELFLNELEKNLRARTGDEAKRDLWPANDDMLSDITQVTNNALAEHGVEREVIEYVMKGLSAVFEIWTTHIKRTLDDMEGWEEAA